MLKQPITVENTKWGAEDTKYAFNTIRTEGKYEIFVNKIKNNLCGFTFFKNCHIFYQNW
jgi:hypothetical protein